MFCFGFARPPISVRTKKWPVKTEMGGRDRPKQVAGKNRNGWPTYSEMGGRFTPKYTRELLEEMETLTQVRYSGKYGHILTEVTKPQRQIIEKLRIELHT